MIVKDCDCTKCRPEWGPGCFLGPHHSSSFNVSYVSSFMGDALTGKRVKQAPTEAHMLINYGSGAVATRVASDEVRLGSVKTYMKDGLLLIIDQKLDIHDRFEGILGLGRPEFQGAPKQPDIPGLGPDIDLHVPGIFEQADVQRFSMCLNHQADGVLGMNTPQHANPLTSVGRMHWGLDFHGISLGDKKVNLNFCDPRSKKEGMQTACGLIPDSGTTMITGPKKQLEILYEAVCNSWPRCMDLQKQLEIQAAEQVKSGNLRVPGGEGDGTKIGSVEVSPVDTLQMLLMQCSDWMAGVDINKEMPTMTFHVAGAHGNKEALVLSPKSYVLLNEEVQVPMIIKRGKKDVKVMQQKQVCMMAFSPLAFDTEQNGAVWIMGMPVFYEHTAHYDRGQGNEKGVTIGFTRRDQEACGQCESFSVITRPSLITSSTSQTTGLESLNRLTKPPLMRTSKKLKWM
eukprot:Skav216493  [mRNA]  locus=scaffold1123:516738:518105:- [translate_table: standard]